MTNKSALPLTILDTIFFFATRLGNAIDLRRWRSQVPLLHICRAWRSVCRSFIFNHAFIDMDYIPGGKVVFKTNFDLIISSNSVRYVRFLDLDLSNNNALCAFLNSYRNIFDFAHNDWSRIAYLSLSIKNNVARNVEEDPHDESVLEMYQLVDAFAENIPNITQLKLSILRENANAHMILGGELIRIYASKLYKLFYRNATHFQAETCLNNLTIVHIELDSNSEFLLPRLNPEIIVLLHLQNIPSTFRWSYFQETKPNQIIFSSLIELCLSFAPDDTNEVLQNLEEVESGALEIRFTKVKGIEFSGVPSLSVLGPRYKFPRYIDKIYMEDNTLLASIVLPNQDLTADELYLEGISIDEFEENEFYESTNFFFHKDRKAKFTQLVLNDYASNLDLSRVQWNNLRKFSYKGFCDFDVLLQIVKGIPSLETLAIFECAFTCIPQDILAYMYPNYAKDGCNNAQSNMLPLVAPLSTKIKELTIGSLLYNGWSANVASICIQFLALFCPSLEELGLGNAGWMHLESFIEKFKKWYPHLGKIELLTT